MVYLIKKDCKQLHLTDIVALKAEDKNVNDKLSSLKDAYENQMRILAGLKEERINKLKKGDPLTIRCYQDGKSIHCYEAYNFSW